MSAVVTAADVFSAIDSDHAVGEIRRVGGGLYRFVPGDGSTPPDDVADFDSAVALSDAFVAELEKDPQASGDSLALRKALTDLADANATIQDLQAKLLAAGIKLTADAAVATLVGKG